MSWQAYVDSNLVGSKAVVKAAILGQDGAKWAASSSFNVTQEEGKTLFAAFKDPFEIRNNGLFIAGMKYLCIRADERSIYGKQGATGAVCVKTGKSILVGVYNETSQPGQAANVVEKLADYLLAQGY
eukprot:TRINITY_DN11000_c0_g1_i1.p1 TRINITY_DN11000_c0_g1~~TRINITY_DN11000_c0_g1_i1.p1  ORF type:complete len:127 (-),score=34.56 TRINITY_DN11000_c0_g1_i1:7-387(-)